MDKMRLGYDVNLGLPAGFVEAVGCEASDFSDLSLLIDSFEQKKVDAIFIPAGTLPYVKKYDIVSQSLFGPKHATTLQTNFVTTENINLQNIVDYTLGRVNKYCTTSFWAPLIYLMNYLPEKTVLKFENTLGFQDLLFKTAEAKIDGAMLWDIILQQNPSATAKVHKLFFLKNLPSPVIVTHAASPHDSFDKINQFKTTDTTQFFTGFQKPDLNAIRQFQSAVQKVINFYKLSLS